MRKLHLQRINPEDDSRSLWNCLSTFPNNYFCVYEKDEMLEKQTRICYELIFHRFISILVSGALIYNGTCAGHKLELAPPTVLHAAARLEPSFFLLLPSFSDHELLESGGEHLLRREKWVGRECEEERGGGVPDLAVTASRGTGLEPLWPDLLLRLPVSLISAQYCSCRDFLLHFKNLSGSHFSPRTILRRLLPFF